MAGCLGPSPAILKYLALEMCAKSKENHKTPYFGVQSFKVTSLNYPQKARR